MPQKAKTESKFKGNPFDIGRITIPECISQVACGRTVSRIGAQYTMEAETPQEIIPCLCAYPENSATSIVLISPVAVISLY
jgi:hypothetical protein